MKPQDARLSAGSDVTIACSARGASSLSWRRVGVAVLPEHVTGDGGRLRLQGVRRTDAGLYVCAATSADRSQTIETVIRIDVTGGVQRFLALLINCLHRKVKLGYIVVRSKA